MPRSEQVHTLIIGGGQAGLAAGYFVKKLGLDCLILDAAARTGDSWRRRWDSLRLFTPSKFNGLPGKKFMKADFYFPTKDEVADYLGEYVDKFSLPVRQGVTVGCVARKNGLFAVTAGDQHYTAENIIVATGAYRNPIVPPCAKELDPSIVQIHSDDYRNPGQLPEGQVLVVGAGNSGAEISIELANAGRKVWLAGRDVGRIPAETLGHILGGHPYWLLMTRVFNVKTPIGRKMQSQALHKGSPLIRLNTEKVMEAGVIRTPRLKGVKGGLPQLVDGCQLDVAGIVWATGYRPDFGWIKLPIAGQNGYPVHAGGVVRKCPGLYFVGLHFQTSLSSALLGGVGNDARIVVENIAASEKKVLPGD